MKRALLPLFLVALALRADDAPSFPGENAGLGRRFAELIRKEDQARKAGSDTVWAEVLDEYQAIITAAGNELVPLDSSLSVQALRACQARLERLPADVRKRYRARVEGPARKWLEDGTARRDPRLLQRIVDEAAVTDEAHTALERLGDLALERGDFEEAEFWWRRLGDEPAGQARLLLSRWLRGDREDWPADLESFRRRHPKAEGRLAGETGLLWKRLGDVSLREREPVGDSGDWTTFAGAGSRQRILPPDLLTPRQVGRLCRDGRHYRVPLSSGNEPAAPREVKTPGDVSRSLAFCPLIVGDRVLYCDARFVYAVDAHTGKREVWLDAQKLTEGFNPDLGLPALADLRYTLNVAGDCVLVRLGVQGLRGDRTERELPREGASLVVCLDLVPDARGNRVRWRVTPEALHASAVFEGSPAVVNGLACIAVTRWQANGAMTSVQAYPIGARGSPAPRWKRDVCTGRDIPGQARYRHNLLTVGGPNLYYCSHSGAIVALDAATGRLLWGRRYRRIRMTEDENRPVPPRDINPCIYADGLLCVAPTDSDILLCIDAVTGNLVWERERIEVQHLLGVGKGRVIFTTRTPVAGLRALNARDGGDRGGWFRSGITAPIHSSGRGLLAGDLVAWPVLDRVYFVRQEDGEQPDDPTLTHRLPLGNLAFGNGILAVAGQEELHVFTPPRLELPQRKKDAEDTPDSSQAQFRLGVALADAGQPESALEALQKSIRLADAPKRQAIRAEMQRALLASAERRLAQGECEPATQMFDRATEKDMPLPLRLEALRRELALWQRAGEWGRAVRAGRGLLADSELTRARVVDECALPQSARNWALGRLDVLLREPGVAEEFDRSFPRAESLAEMEKGARQWPDTPKLRALLPVLARKLEEDKRPGAATAVLRRLLRSQPDEATRSQARADLERLYAGQGNRHTPPAALSLPLTRSWTLEGQFLFPAECCDRFFGIRGQTLSCHHADTGKQLWTRALPVTSAWVGLYLDTVIAAGVDGACCLTLNEGEILWELRDGPWPMPPRLDGDRLVVARKSNDRLILDAETGMTLERQREEAEGIVHARGLRLAGRTTLSGEPITHVPVSERSLLLLVPRNHGTTLERFDSDGQRWSVLLPASVSTDSLSHDGMTCWLAHDGRVSAYALEDGRRHWQRRLPGAEGRWRTRLAGDWVLAWPRERCRVAVPVPLTLGRLECNLSWDAEPTRPLFVCDARSGQPAQRLNLPSGLPVVSGGRRWGKVEPEDGPVEMRTPAGGLIVRSGLGVAHFESAAR